MDNTAISCEYFFSHFPGKSLLNLYAGYGNGIERKVAA